MNIGKADYTEAFTKMSESLNFFVKAVESKPFSFMATDKWTVKDVLCHIVFWHTNYAENYQALVKKEKPPLLEGPGYKLNEDGVNSLRKYSVSSLIKKLHSAQESLYQSIVIKKIHRMTYKKSTMRVFETEEFLNLVARHLHTHAKHVLHAKQVPLTS